MCRHFFRPHEDDLALAKARARLQRLLVRAPARTSGRHAFLGALIGEARNTVQFGAKLAPGVSREIMKQHTRVYSSLSIADRAAFDRKAAVQAELKLESNREEVVYQRSALQLQESRLLAEGRGGCD